MKVSLLALTREAHQTLDEVLLLHQEALLERKADLALRALGLFQAMLHAHIQIEEQDFFSAHDSCAHQRWPAALYEKEHRKIEQLLQSCVPKIKHWQQRGCQRRELIAILDYQRSLKNVLEHHEQREELALLPELDGQLADVERLALFRRADAQWRTLREQQAAAFSELKQSLEH